MTKIIGYILLIISMFNLVLAIIYTIESGIDWFRLSKIFTSEEVSSVVASLLICIYVSITITTTNRQRELSELKKSNELIRKKNELLRKRKLLGNKVY